MRRLYFVPRPRERVDDCIRVVATRVAHERIETCGKNRNARYSDATGSLQESVAVIEVAEASGFIRRRPEKELATMLHIANTLFKCARAAG